MIFHCRVCHEFESAARIRRDIIYIIECKTTEHLTKTFEKNWNNRDTLIHWYENISVLPRSRYYPWLFFLVDALARDRPHQHHPDNRLFSVEFSRIFRLEFYNREISIVFASFNIYIIHWKLLLWVLFLNYEIWMLALFHKLFRLFDFVRGPFFS